MRKNKWCEKDDNMGGGRLVVAFIAKTFPQIVAALVGNGASGSSPAPAVNKRRPLGVSVSAMRSFADKQPCVILKRY